MCTSRKGKPAFCPHVRCDVCGFRRAGQRERCVRCRLRLRMERYVLAEEADQVVPRQVLAAVLDAMFDAQVTTAYLGREVVTSARGTLLREVLTGQVPATHQGLMERDEGRAGDVLRTALVAAGVLAWGDVHLERLERWVRQQVAQLEDPSVAALVEQYATWRLLTRLRATSRPGAQMAPAQAAGIRARLIRVIAFLTWLAERGLRPQECSQLEVDTWFATSGPYRDRDLRHFLAWAHRQRLMPALKVAALAPQAPEGAAPADLSRWLHQSLGGEHPLATRLACCLLLLFGVPLQRIVDLRRDAIEVREGTEGPGMWVRLGTQPVEVPAPFDHLVASYLAERDARVSYRDSPWLFPGRNPQRPLNIHTLREAVKATGLRVKEARNGALRDMAIALAPNVVAEVTGYAPRTAIAHAQRANVNWRSYPSTRRATRDKSS